jgi:hypothetical protein
MRLIGLYREAECSPGRHRSNDALLLEQVGQALRTRGFQVDLMTVDQATPRRASASLVFSMCQGRAALDTLARWEVEGTRIVNSPGAARNTYRDRLAGVLRSAGIRFPPTEIVSTARGGDPAIEVNGGVWLKRGDVHASISADVQWIDSADGLRAGLREFASRGITHAVLQPHHTGSEIKFYAVAGSDFFHCFRPSSSQPTAEIPDAAALRRLAGAAAAAAGLEVLGGDVIVAPGGELTLIDLNDWPSFAPCRERASDAIADYLMRRVDAAWNPGLVATANQSAV